MPVSGNILREQRELASRLRRLRQRCERQDEVPLEDRRTLAAMAMRRRGEVQGQRLRAARLMRWLELDPSLVKVAVLMLVFSLVLTWNVRQLRAVTARLEDNPYCPRPAAPTVANPALAYAGRILAACRIQGSAALQGQWVDGLPDYLQELSAKALAPYLAAPSPALAVAAVEQRRDSVFVRFAGQPDLHLTVHLRERAPGQYALVAVE